MNLVRCVDSVTASAVIDYVRRHPGAIALGYVDGAYQTYEELVAARIPTVAITVAGRPDTAVVDCEPGNISPDATVSWAVRELRAGRRPTIYGGSDVHDQVYRGLEARRIDPGLVDYFLARYVQVAPPLGRVRFPRFLPRGYSAWQFADSIPVADGHSIDLSVASLAWTRRHIPHHPRIRITRDGLYVPGR